MIFLFIKRYYLFHAFLLGNHCEKAIVGSYEKIVLSHKKNGLSVPPYLGIHYRQVNRSLWKIGIGVGQDKGSFPNIVRAYLVGNIDKKTLRIDVQNHALHRSNIMVFCAKIGEQSNNGLTHPPSLKF